MWHAEFWQCIILCLKYHLNCERSWNEIQGICGIDRFNFTATLGQISLSEQSESLPGKDINSGSPTDDDFQPAQPD